MRKLATILLASAVLAGCSTNPATGKRELSLVSEQQAIQMGAQAHEQTLQQYGVYDEKPELNRLVDELGKKIAAASDRPELPWTFTILDSPMVNAMALPGGHIYVTRGILVRMNSEDELAGVLAHEVAHVAARHAEQRISQAQLAQFGLVLGSIFAGPAATQAYGGLAQLGAELLFLRYSRQQETHADVLGTAYMAEAGFNPRGSENMLRVLQRLDRGKGSSLDQYFVSHPDPAKRVQTIQGEIGKLEQQGTQLASLPMERSGFVQRLEGVIVGDSTLRTTIRDNTVYERRHGIITAIPAGWTAVAPPGALFAMAPEKNATTQLVVQEVPLEKLRGSSVQNGIRTALQNMGLRYVTSANARTRSGDSLTLDLWSGQTQQGVVAVETTQFTAGDQAVVFMQITRGGLRSGDSQLSRMLSGMTFDRAAARRAEPPRMRIGTVTASTWADVAARATGDRSDATQLAHINGFDASQPVPRSFLLKLPQDVAAD
jgi:predicted Zn-dependent protease